MRAIIIVTSKFSYLLKAKKKANKININEKAKRIDTAIFSILI